jgi:F-type H+-transporting ATPase subunit b
MQINWFEIVVQMINFFILLFILQKLLYGPVINVMEKRQERIQAQQREADGKVREAQEREADFTARIAALENQKQVLLEEAKEEARLAKEEILESFRTEAGKKREGYHREVEEEKERFLRELRATLGQKATQIAGGILAMISHEELEDKIFAAFLQKVEALNPEILEEERGGKERLILKSAAELSQAQKSALEKSLHDAVGDFDGISYVVDDALILGYELKLETLTVHTNITKYLEETEKSIVQALENKSF